MASALSEEIVMTYSKFRVLGNSDRKQSYAPEGALEILLIAVQAVVLPHLLQIPSFAIRADNVGSRLLVFPLYFQAA